MNLPLDGSQIRDLLFGIAGVVGLALLALAAARMTRNAPGWSSRLLVAGAVLLLVARVHALASPHLLTPSVLAGLNRIAITTLFTLPPLMLTVGLIAVVWGLWGQGRLPRRG